MKVIKEGSWKNPWSAELPCTNKNCGAVLSVEEGDVKATFDELYAFHFVCPVCASQVKIAKASLPPRLTDALEKRRRYREHSHDPWD